MKRVFLLLVLLLADSAAFAGCNRAAYKEARIRCAGNPDQSCELDVYTAIEGISSGTDYLACSLGAFGEAMEMTVDDKLKRARPSGVPQDIQRGGRSQPYSEPPSAFQGIPHFGAKSPSAPPSSATSYQNMLPPQVVEMMNRMQRAYSPNSSLSQCQGVATSKLVGYDQAGTKSSASTLSKFDVVQLVKSQENNGRLYYLASNGFWYDAGYIKKSSGCSL